MKRWFTRVAAASRRCGRPLSAAPPAPSGGQKKIFCGRHVPVLHEQRLSVARRPSSPHDTFWAGKIFCFVVWKFCWFSPSFFVGREWQWTDICIFFFRNKLMGSTVINAHSHWNSRRNSQISDDQRRPSSDEEEWNADAASEQQQQRNRPIGAVLHRFQLPLGGGGFVFRFGRCCGRHGRRFRLFRRAWCLRIGVQLRHAGRQRHDVHQNLRRWTALSHDRRQSARTFSGLRRDRRGCRHHRQTDGKITRLRIREFICFQTQNFRSIDNCDRQRVSH